MNFNVISRRLFVQSNVAAACTTSSPSKAEHTATVVHPFQYSAEWTGTALPLLSLTQAVELAAADRRRWPMGRWPDPILRRSADAVGDSMFGTATLHQACEFLRNTAVEEGAVGLAAQQCGVNARIVYLERNDVYNRAMSSYLTLINPLIIDRSPEMEMRVWRENCLVLPPTFQATVLRDAWVDVSYQDWRSSDWQTLRLKGETARAVQHEMDHDRGILVTDHVGLDELESDLMRSIELPGHEIRMVLAYGSTHQTEP